MYEFIFEIFGVTNEKDCTALSLAAAKLKQMLKADENSPVYDAAEVLSDILTMMYSLITRLHVAGISCALDFMCLFDKPDTLQDAKEVMLIIQEAATPELLDLYKTAYDIKEIKDYMPSIIFSSSDFTEYDGVLGMAADKRGYDELGICYATSHKDAQLLAPNLIQPPETLLPLVAKKGVNSPFSKIAEESSGIKSNTVPMIIPFVSA